ncbi:recombinase family protein [Rhodobacter capsulatus]|uniref:recombinase family protein n=1 Tax=Rhodobacter capsulatus TaxID=1061 RepID=UPI0003D2F2CF|nr:recombinase family protein [Rhodobacter capsulatus]ETD88910.1 hypothetical protein U713_12380 [Rhodobacter capsulatus YW2]
MDSPLHIIGFYWTLPVPWRGFIRLPGGIDEAAAASRSIRYQRERVWRWAKDEGGQVVAEEAFLETRADRGTSAILPEVERLLAKAEAMGATLAVVNFAESFHWRPHASLWGRLQAAPRVMALDPAPVLIDGQMFDPVTHFRAWGEMAAAHTALKPKAKAEIAARIRRMKDTGASYAEIAKALNAEGVTTPGGKPWRADNLRKLLAAL